MADFYNDSDAGACAWMRELIKAGLISEGSVDERSIADVRPEELDGYERCHFFAGIAGWDYALRLAGWPADRPVWTGSCPCQPFSAAGKRKGQADERHLWPVFFRLIGLCRPATVFGEQVASDDGYRWLARVRDDLETEGYAVGCADLPACCAGAPHIRQRLFWVAHWSGSPCYAESGNGSIPVRQRGSLQKSLEPGRASSTGDIPDAANHRTPTSQQKGQPETKQRCQSFALSDANGAGRIKHGRAVATGAEHAAAERAGFWSDFGIIQYRDGKARRVESGSFPLVDGFPGRVVLLRGYGNAIVPPVAAAFIQAFLDTEAEPCP